MYIKQKNNTLLFVYYCIKHDDVLKKILCHVIYNIYIILFRRHIIIIIKYKGLIWLAGSVVGLTNVV